MAKAPVRRRTARRTASSRGMEDGPAVMAASDSLGTCRPGCDASRGSPEAFGRVMTASDSLASRVVVAGRVLGPPCDGRGLSAAAPLRRRWGGADALGVRFGCFGGGEFELVLDDVGDDLGVGFGGELVAFGDEGGFELEVVFDDAVVDDDERAGAVAVGVGVFFGGAAVGGPAGVADAVGALHGVFGEDRGRGCGACRGRGGVGGRRGHRRRRCRRSHSRGTRGGRGLP